MSFPEKLKSLREMHNHTQQMLADLLGVRKSSISNYENGHSYPKRVLLLKIAKIYNIPPASLLETEGSGTVSDVNGFETNAAKQIFVYKNLSDCLLAENPSVLYCISLPAALIGNGEYKAFTAPDGNIIIVDVKSSPKPGNTVFAISDSGKIICGQYVKNASAQSIISKYIDDKEETAVFDVKKDKVTVLAVAVKIFGNMSD